MKKEVISNIRDIVIQVRENQKTIDECAFPKNLIDAVAFIIDLSHEDVTAKGRRTISSRDITKEQKIQAIAILTYLKDKTIKYNEKSSNNEPIAKNNEDDTYTYNDGYLKSLNRYVKTLETPESKKLKKALKKAKKNV